MNFVERLQPSIKALDARAAVSTAWRLCDVVEQQKTKFPRLSYEIVPYQDAELAGAIQLNCLDNRSRRNECIAIQILKNGWFRVYFADNNMFIGDGRSRGDRYALAWKMRQLSLVYKP